MNAEQFSKEAEKVSPIDRINHRLDLLLQEPYAGIRITPIREASGDSHSVVEVGLSSIDANVTLQRILQHIDLTRMVEYSNSGSYLNAFNSAFSDASFEIDKVKKQVTAFKKSFSEKLSEIAGDLHALEFTQPHTKAPDLDETKARLIVLASIVSTVEKHLEPRLAAVGTFFANKQNSDSIISSLRQVSYLVETDTRSVGSAIGFRKFLIGGTALGLLTHLALSAIMNPLIQAPVFFLLAIPFFVMASSFFNGTRRRNSEAKGIQDAVAGFLNRQLMPASVEIQPPGRNQIFEMGQRLTSLAAAGTKPDLTAMLDACKIRVQNAPSNRIEPLNSNEQLVLPTSSYSGDPAQKSPIHKVNQAAVAFAWSLLLAFAPLSATLGLSWLATMGGESWPVQTLLAPSAGRENCQLGRGRVFLQTWDNVYIRNLESGDIKILPRSSVYETRYGKDIVLAAKQDIKPCGTVDGLYNAQVAVHSNPVVNTPVQVAGPTIYLPGSALEKQADGATILPRQRSIILPFFQSDIRKNDAARNAALDPKGAFKLGFDQSTIDPLKTVLVAFRQSFLACRTVSSLIKLDIKGYASNKLFDGVSKSKSDELNHWLAEGRRAGVMSAIGLQPPSPAEPLSQGMLNAGLSIDPGIDEPPVRDGFRFRSYENMRQNLGVWHLEPRGADSNQTEAFARSVVISFDDQELRKCDQEIKSTRSQP